MWAEIWLNIHDFNNHLDSLLRDTDNGIKKKGRQYIYMYKANNKVYECNIIPYPSSIIPLDTIAPIHHYSFVFDNSIVFFRGNVMELFEDMKNENKELNFAECQLDYRRSYERKGRWIEKKHTANIYCWSSQNLGIILTDYPTLSMSFYNATNVYPSSKFLDIVRSIKAIKEKEKAKTIERQKKKKFGI